jgi:plastocyanin
MHRAAPLSTMLLVGVLAAGCGSSSAPASSSPAAASPAAPSAAAGASAVTIVDFAFQPADLTVKVDDTVTWTNTGEAPHAVKWSDGEPESEQLAKGDTHQRTFDKAGSYPYVCGIHSNMTGTITVQ